MTTPAAGSALVFDHPDNQQAREQQPTQGTMRTDVEKGASPAPAQSNTALYGMIAVLFVLVIPALVLGAYSVSLLCDGDKCANLDPFRTSPLAMDSVNASKAASGASTTINVNVAAPATAAPSTGSHDTSTDSTGEHADQASHWDYSDFGASWTGVCATGIQQSPIDIVTNKVVSSDKNFKNIDVSHDVQAVGAMLDGNTFSKTASIMNNGHAIKADGIQGYFQRGGKWWKLLQFHFHTPSEHTIDGKSYPAEVHLVHHDENMNLLVIGIMIEEAAASDPQPAWAANMMSKVKAATLTPEAMELVYKDMIDQSFGGEAPFYYYQGSLTTPPCSENVQWNVLQTPIKFTKDDIALLTEAQHVSNRAPQPLNGRTVYSSVSSDKWDYANPNEDWDVYETCKTGRRQSPIDICKTGFCVCAVPETEATPCSANPVNDGDEGAESRTHITPATDFQTVAELMGGAGAAFGDFANAAKVFNNGHTVQATDMTGGYFKFSSPVHGTSNDWYKLLQFHFHTPSENTVDGQHYGAEVHLVHQNAAGKLLVVGCLINDAGNNVPEPSWVVDLLNKAPGTDAAGKQAIPISLDYRAMITSITSSMGSAPFWSWSGSLTTPECTEEIQWVLLKTPIDMPHSAIKKLEELEHHNSRPIQPINGRIISNSKA